jgi:hypothetical protein
MEDELNTWSQIAKGLGRRPPTQVIDKLTALVGGTDYSIHHINRDVFERYTVIIKNGGILVYDETTGAPKTVNAPRGYGYLDQDGDVYRAVTVADYTFIVNTKKTVAMKAVGDDQIAQDTNNRWLGGTNPRDFLAPIAGHNLFGGALGQYKPNPTYSGGLTGTVADMTKLPATVCSGCVYKVLGAQETSFVSYYVMGDGVVWNETVLPGLVNAIDELTMPWALIREADGTFTFAPFSWKPRRVGDLDTNPLPPFIDRTIRDVFFYQNRLGFVVDDGVVFSAAGDLGDFFRRTVLDYIDSDTIAASAATTDVALIDWALPYSDGVMLFSRQKQLSLTNGDAGLSAHSLAIAPVTNYVMSTGVRPTPMGSQAHFITDQRGYASVQEYTRLAGSNPTEAADITAHVPRLIPKGASHLIPAADLDALFVITHDAASAADRTKLYAYQFFWDGEKKFQSAWRVWDFVDGTPISGAYESGSLILLMERSDGVYLEKIDLSPGAVSPNQDHTIFLDRQKSLTGVYDAGTDVTTFTLGYPPDATKLRIVRGIGSAHAESLIDPSTYTIVGNTVKVPGDESAAAATVGHVYTTKWVPSRQYPYDWQNRPLTTGRLQLHNFTVNVEETAYFRAEVYPYGTKVLALQPDLKSIVTFTPLVIGDATAILGAKVYYSGPFTFSVAGNAAEVRIELVNDSPFDSLFTSAEWEGLFFSRAL